MMTSERKAYIPQQYGCVFPIRFQLCKPYLRLDIPSLDQAVHHLMHLDLLTSIENLHQWLKRANTEI